MQAPLRDIWWTFRFLDELPPENGLPDERCGDTVWADRTVRIRNGMRIRDELNTILHEGLHAGFGRQTDTPGWERRIEAVSAFLTDVLRQVYTIRRKRK